MRLLVFIGTLSLAAATNPASTLWTELKAKRDSLPGVHQEFEVTRTFTTAHGTQSSKRDVIIDMAPEQWRERSVSGSGNQIRIFDGRDLFRMEEGGDEYVRPKRSSKDDDPEPSPYSSNEIDTSKAKELEHRPCGTPGNDHVCVVLEIPVKKWTRPNPTFGGQLITLVQGIQRIILDTETGLALGSLTVEMIDDHRSVYRSDTKYVQKRFSIGAPPQKSLFQPSEGLREVKELSKWNAARIKRELAGRPAPDLTVTDLKGQPLTLSAFKGRTVLLDFWTTWCPPCRADAPAIHDLYRKYGDKDLSIISISVSEDREVVEKFLKEHPADYSVVLTSENEMPRPYQVSTLPTYIIVDRDGMLAAAVEGDKGFSELRKLLKRAGLETE